MEPEEPVSGLGDNIGEVFSGPSSDGLSHNSPAATDFYPNDIEIWGKDDFRESMQTCAPIDDSIGIIVVHSHHEKQVCEFTDDRILEILHPAKFTSSHCQQITISIKCAGQKREHGRQPLPLSARLYLMKWLDENSANPYPSPSDWATIIRDTQLSRKQISTFFVNNRSRHLKRNPKKGKANLGDQKNRIYAPYEDDGNGVPFPKDSL